MSSRQQTQNALQELIGDKYEVLRWIGGGGMADVFLALHRRHGGKVAVKVLAENLANDESIVARFLDEARTAARLSGHPNIVTIFDVGEGQVGKKALHYLTMQYVAGEDLGRYLAREGKLPVRDAVHIGLQVADALVWAASNQVVHRDLKPANIRLDQYGRAIVLDFGIAKAGDQGAGRTTLGERLGTPYYMSPEQIRGQHCDQRSDLYSLGIVLYELATGKRPFDGDTARAIEDAHLSGIPPRPEELNPSISPEFSGLISRLMAKSPEDRYQTPAELLLALKALETGAATLHPQSDDAAGLIAESSGIFTTLSNTTSSEATIRKPTNGFIEPSKSSVEDDLPDPRLGGKRASWPVFTGGAALLGLLIALGLYSAGMFSKPRPPVKQEVQTVVAKNTLPKTLADDTGLMLLVPAGEFIFGSDAPDSPNKPGKISLPAYYIDTTEVPNGIYKKFCEASGHRRPDNPDLMKALDYPVVGVTFEDAQAFAQWAGKRLPTEQEWEKAARGTDGRAYPWGNETLESPKTLQPVDVFPERQSPYGALNMAGNAWEWTTTRFPATEREIADLKHVLGVKSVSPDWYSIKGGSFPANQERFFRAFMRRGWPKDVSSPYIGFRCVKDAKSS